MIKSLLIEEGGDILDIQKLIDDYTTWLRKEIRFEKVGEYYEISTPFLDNSNDHIQFYVRLEGDTIHFTDDGFTLNQLMISGFQINANRKKVLCNILKQYGVELSGDAITTKADIKNFPQKKHMYIQAIMKVDDLFMTARSKNTSSFLEDIQNFFSQRDIFYSDNVQFTGTSGFFHNYEFLMQRSKNKPERLCRIMNTPNKNNLSNILFAWSDTKPSRRDDSQLVVLLNDSNTVSRGVEEAFANYEAKVVKWSEKDKSENLDILTA